MADDTRLKKQLSFLAEIDKMKTVLRRSVIIDGTKNENDAEHSWHMAMFAMLLFEYAPSPEIDQLRVIKMALVHDLIEVYAGDTFCYDEAGNATKEAREKEAADRLFSILPEDQGSEIRALWEEFDRMDTPDSMYAAAIDRLQPLLLNYCTSGTRTWQTGDIHSSDVYRRLDPVRTGIPSLWEAVDSIIKECIASGKLKK